MWMQIDTVPGLCCSYLYTQRIFIATMGPSPSFLFSPVIFLCCLWAKMVDEHQDRDIPSHQVVLYLLLHCSMRVFVQAPHHYCTHTYTTMVYINYHIDAYL